MLRASQDSRAKTEAIVRAGLPIVGRQLAWPAMLRKLDRLDASYRE